MKRLTTLLAVAALMMPTRALAAEPYEPTEIEYQRFETRLQEIFEISSFKENNIKFLSTSSIAKRAAGAVYCRTIDKYSVEHLLDDIMKTRYSFYKDSPKTFKDEMTYEYAVTFAAVETICPQHTAELKEFFESM